MDSFISLLLYGLVSVVFAVVVFLVLRALVLWYWRINEMADNIAIIAQHCHRLDQEASRERVGAIRSSSRLIP